MAGEGATWHEDQLVPVTRHGRREDVWWTYSFGPIDLEGKVGGVLVVCRDVTSEHMAREALNLINQELKHRVKNTLTVLGAVATQIFRDAHRAKPTSKNISDAWLRSDARTMCSPRHIGRKPCRLINTAPVPLQYREGEDRFAVSGPPLIVKSRQALALSLAIHELATNALKYGVLLTARSGRVSIGWSVEDREGTPNFVFTWQERG